MNQWDEVSSGLYLGQDSADPGASSAHIPASLLQANIQAQPRPETLPTGVQKICLLILCMDILSGFANEYSQRFFHTSAYLSAVTAVLLPLLLLMSGSFLRGLRIPLGRWWLAFGAWLVVAAPFSFWRSNSVQLLTNYYFRTYLLFFAICACAVGGRQLTKVMYTLAASAGLIVITCLAFGSMSDDARFSVHDSHFSFLANSNELALALLLGIVILIYPFFLTRKWPRLLSLAVIPIAAMYLMKSGSRGVFIGFVAVLLAALLLARNKTRLVAISL